MRIFRILLIALFVMGVQDAFSEIYQWTDENGNLKFSDSPPPISDDADPGPEEEIEISLTETIIKGLPEPGSIIFDIRWLLEQRAFAELNRILEGFQAVFESDVSAEENLYTAYNAFAVKKSSYESLLNAWVRATPDKYQPYVARAEFYYHMGWEARGTRWASETKQEQFDQMNNYFSMAAKDIDRALSINERSIVPYSLLIGIKNTQGKDEAAAEAVKKALEIYPASYKVREHYFWALIPRWGGSYKEMQAFIEASLVHVSKNPKLKLLEGRIYQDFAELQAIARKYSVAEELYTRVLAYGDNHQIFAARGKNSYRRENYEDAVNDLNRAIRLYPEDGEYYYWRSMAYGKLEQYHNALTDIELADQLKPNDEYIENQRKWVASRFKSQGHELSKDQNPAAAIEQYDAALRLNPGDAYTYYRKARAFVEQNDLDAALINLEKAIELDPDEISFYLSIDWVLARRGEWDRIISYWDHFIALHPDNSRAYVERGGAYYHKGDMTSAVRDAKTSADMGNPLGREALQKIGHLAR